MKQIEDFSDEHKPPELYEDEYQYEIEFNKNNQQELFNVYPKNKKRNEFSEERPAYASM